MLRRMAGQEHPSKAELTIMWDRRFGKQLALYALKLIQEALAHLSHEALVHSAIQRSAQPLHYEQYQSSSSQLALPRVVLELAHLPPLKVEYMLKEDWLDTEHTNKTQQNHKQDTQSHAQGHGVLLPPHFPEPRLRVFDGNVLVVRSPCAHHAWKSIERSVVEPLLEVSELLLLNLLPRPSFHRVVVLGAVPFFSVGIMIRVSDGISCRFLCIGGLWRQAKPTASLHLLHSEHDNRSRTGSIDLVAVLGCHFCSYLLVVRIPFLDHPTLAEEPQGLWRGSEGGEHDRSATIFVDV
jgi:hypothetical protein